MMKIEFVDLQRQYLAIKSDIDAIQRIIDDSAFIGGEEVSRFEEEFRRVLRGTRYLFCPESICV